MTVTPEHARRLKELHDRDPNFGAIAYLWAPRIFAWMNEGDCKSILDYGCGKATLIPALCKMGLDFSSQEYDPATAPGIPKPADFVACIDVLEHVEEDQIEAVLADIKRLTKKIALVTISLRNRRKKSRPVHPLVLSRERWLMFLYRHFEHVQEVVIINPEKARSELAVIIRP